MLGVPVPPANLSARTIADTARIATIAGITVDTRIGGGTHTVAVAAGATGSTRRALTRVRRLFPPRRLSWMPARLPFPV